LAGKRMKNRKCIIECRYYQKCPNNAPLYNPSLPFV
jgi:hypothetical protein